MSRPLLLLQREEYWMKTKPVWGIKAEIVDSDYYHWIAKINGLTGTSWEGGIFAVELYFSREYDNYPPKVTFLTIPFHPNIDMTTGRPCVDFLDNPDLWVPGTTLIGLLQSLQLLLVEPVLENAVNIFAAQAFLNSPHLYNQLVKDCVVASCKVEAGISPYNEAYNDEEVYGNIKEDSNGSENNDNDSNAKVLLSSENTQKIKKISFEDYYKDWMNSATYLPKLNESRFKRYSHNNEEYVVRRTNNSQEFIQYTDGMGNSHKNCVVKSLKVNENNVKSSKNTNNKKNIETSSKPDVAKKDESNRPITEKQTEETESKATEKSSLVKASLSKSLTEKVMENMRKHEFTYIIDRDTDQITYIRKFFGKMKEEMDSGKSSKKTTSFTVKKNNEHEIENELYQDRNYERERDIDQDLGYHQHPSSINYDHVYHAVMSNKKNKNEKESFDYQNKPMVNIRDSQLYQYKFGHRYLKIVDVKEIEKKLCMSLTQEEKEILNKIRENEVYYNMFLNELEEIQIRKEIEEFEGNNINDPEDRDDNINTDKMIKNEYNLPFRNNALQIRAKHGTTEYDYSLLKDQKEMITNENEKSNEMSSPNMSPLKASNDNAIEDNTNIISNEKKIININDSDNKDSNSSLKNRVNGNDNDNDLMTHTLTDDKGKAITNEINTDNMNKSVNNNKNVTVETEKLLNGEDPDGILDWCDNLDQTKIDNIGLI